MVNRLRLIFVGSFISDQLAFWVTFPFKIFLLDFSEGQKCVTKWQFLLIFLKRVDKNPFLRPHIRAKDAFSYWGFRDSIWDISALMFSKK